MRGRRQKGRENMEEIQTEIERKYVTWICEGGDPRMRPRGKAMTTGCGMTNYKVSKQTFERPPKGGIKGLCRHCGRKRNLNPGNVRFHESKEAMIHHVEIVNFQTQGWDE